MGGGILLPEKLLDFLEKGFEVRHVSLRRTLSEKFEGAHDFGNRAGLDIGIEAVTFWHLVSRQPGKHRTIKVFPAILLKQFVDLWLDHRVDNARMIAFPLREHAPGAPNTLH